MRSLGAGGWTWFSDPRAMYFQGQRWRTSDGGATWRKRTLSHAADGRDAIGPVTARGRAGERDVLWMQGDHRGFFDFRTDVIARLTR